MKYAGLAELILWVGFLTYWVVMAVRTRSGVASFGRGSGMRLVIFLTYALLVRATVVNKPLSAFGGPGAVQALFGIVLTIAGLAFAVWARVYLGSEWGMPMTEKKGGQLITTGPYRLVRHPIYTGMIVGLIGSAVAVGWVLLLPTALLTSYFVVSAILEERYLERTFAHDYDAYRSRSKMLIPYLF